MVKGHEDIGEGWCAMLWWRFGCCLLGWQRKIMQNTWPVGTSRSAGRIELFAGSCGHAENAVMIAGEKLQEDAESMCAGVGGYSV